LERWKEEMPTEQEMLPKDKYTIFDRKEKKYRKGIHSKFACCARWALKMLIIHRASEMDEIVATTQPTRLLI
jgi:hypothetical protein